MQTLDSPPLHSPKLVEMEFRSQYPQKIEKAILASTNRTIDHTTDNFQMD